MAGAEWLESRLALAIVTPFTEVFSANLTGNITFASNTLMTSPASGGQTAIDARQGIGPDQVLNDDFWNMAYVDVDSDGATFNSSSADLVVPSGAVVEFARLYWGGRAANTVPNSLLETVKFKVGAGAYSTLTGSLVGKVIGGVSNRPDNPQTYQSYADVTSLVTGAGTFTVANVQGQEGAKNTCNGWSLVVAYSAPGTPGEVPRNLTVFQGFADVSNDSLADRNVTIPYSGFQAPQTGPVNATLGFVTYEGDLGIAGDQAYFKSQSSASETLLADAPAIPPNNFFNSTISNRGLLVTSKNPDYVNQFGFDADLVTADGIIQNGDTAAQIRVTSTQDQYYPGVITSAIDIYQPGISVTKTVEDLNGGVVDPGDTLRYTVQVSNAAGLFDGATNVVLDDLIPGNTTYVPGSLEITAGANAGPKTDPLDADQAEFTGAAVRFRLGAGATGTPTVQGGTLAPGESTTVRFRVQVNPAIIGGTTITNTAVVSYRSQTFDVPDKKLGTVSIDCPAVDLAITKGGDVAVVTAGDGVNHTYTITVKNMSSSAANNVVVADTWPAGFVPGTIVPGVGSVTGPDPVTGNFTWTIGTLAGMSSATLTAQYTVPASTPASTKTNKVVVTTSTYERNPENNTATFDTTVVTNAVLAIEKTDEPDPVTAGGEDFTYTIRVTNTGLSDAQGVVVVDDLPAGFVTTGFSGPGTLPAVGADPFTWTIGTLVKGATAQLVVTYRVNSNVVPGTYRNTATASSPTDGQGPREAFCDTTVVTNAVLAIEKTDEPDPVTAGGEDFTYTIRVTNTGLSDAQGVVVVDDLPAGFVTTGFSGPGTLPAVGADPFTWTIGTLVKGATAQLVVTYRVNSNVVPGTYRNTATASSPTDGQGPREAFCDTTVVTNAVLAITKTAKEPTVTAGQGGYTYTLTVSNTGPSDATNVNVVDTLPGGFTATAFNPAAGVLPVSPTSGPFTWTIGTVAAGTTKVLEVTYAVAAGVPAGPATNTADVRIGEQVQGTATATVTVGLVGDLGIEKTGPATAIPGTAISYTFVVTNGGPSDVVDALVNDALPAGIVNASWNATYSPGSSGPAAGTGSLAGVLVTLLAGGTGTFTITGSIDPLATGVLVNTSTVSPPEGVTDPNPGNETSTVTTQLVPTADLAAAKQRTSATPTAGSPVTYEIVVTNLGPSSVTSFGIVDVTTPALVGAGTSVDRGTYDPLTGVWTAAAGDSLGSGGTVTFTLSGTIPAGATGTLTNTVTVSPPAGVTDPNPDNNTATVTDPIAAISSLTIVKTGDITYKAGGFLAFQVVVTNRGPSFATGVRVVDALPSGVVNWSWQVTYVGVGSQTTDGSPDSVTASAAGIDKLMNLAVNGTATFTITALTQTGFTSDISNTAQASIGGTTVSSTWTSAFDGPINPESDLPGLVLGSDDGCNGEPFVRFVDPETGDITGAFLAYEASFRGSVRVATGDVTGDGIAEIIVGPGRNRVGEIRVFTPQGVELPAFRTLPFGSRYRGGVEVAVGDVNGDGIGDIVAGMSSGIGRVSVFLVDPTAADPVASTPFRTFRGAPGSYRGGVMIAAGDVGSFASGTLQSAAADGRAEIIVGLNAGRAALVRVFDVAGSPRVVQTIRPFGGGFSGGVTLSTALYESATVSSILVGAGRGGNSVVEVYDGQTGGQVARLQAFASFAKPNAAVFAAALDLDGDGVVNDVYGVQGRAGGGGTRGVKQFDRATSVTSTLTDAAVLVPPMRIAPIVLRVLT